MSMEADSLGNVATVESYDGSEFDGSEFDGSEFDVIPIGGDYEYHFVDIDADATTTEAMGLYQLYQQLSSLLG